MDQEEWGWSHKKSRGIEHHSSERNLPMLQVGGTKWGLKVLTNELKTGCQPRSCRNERQEKRAPSVWAVNTRRGIREKPALWIKREECWKINWTALEKGKRVKKPFTKNPCNSKKDP